jgi:hypothetical protein
MRPLSVVLAAVAVLLVLAGAGSADNPVLTGDVGADDAFAIGLVDSGGAPVTHLDPGVYTIVVHDHSAQHNFHLFGPGVNVTTDVGSIGDSTFTVTFTDGVYRYVCDPHSSLMKGSFTVGTPPAAPPPAPSPVRLSGSVGPGAKIALRGAGGLTAGPAVLTIKDASKTDNFHLVGPGVNRATGIVFRGTVRWTVALQTGAYVFRSDRNKKLRGSFSVG